MTSALVAMRIWYGVGGSVKRMGYMDGDDVSELIAW